MKQRLFKLSLFLILGMIVNIALAWSIAWYGDPLTSMAPHDPITEKDRQWWMENRPTEAVGIPVVRAASSIIGVSELELRTSELDESRRPVIWEGPVYQSFRRQFGIPLPTVEYSYWTLVDLRPVPFNKQSYMVDRSIWTHEFLTPSRRIVHYHAQGALAFENNRPDYRSSARGLPYQFQPLGLLVNTLVYALLCYILMGVSSKIYSWFRKSIGRARSYVGKCPNCNYNLLGHLEQGCPECGWGREAEE